MIALQASVEASEKIMEFYSNGFETEIKHDGSPVTQADLASSEIIDSFLNATGIPITGEETVKMDFEIRKNWAESWCVDPLDGTKEFVKKNGEFAVNIALIRDQRPVFGLIASPVEKRIIFGGSETGVFIADFEHWNNATKWNKIEAAHTINSPLMVTCSRSHHSGPVLQFLHELKINHPEIDFIKRGSALKFFDLALGNADAYPRFAPTMEWDIAAGQAILEALGGIVVHAHTLEPLRYNKENLTNPYFIAKTQALLLENK
jgi:3'(2'), 5'-bisphosphate nucleotidase